MKASERLRRALLVPASHAGLHQAPRAGPLEAPLAARGQEELARGDEHRARLQQLRREVERISRRYVGLVSPLASTDELRVPWDDPVRAPPRPADRPAAELPPAVDDAGLLYRQRIAPGERLGKRPLMAPDGELLQALASLRQLQGGRVAPLCGEEILFLDLETTGLSRGAGTLAFIIGLASFDEEGGLVIDQILLRDPAQELAALELLAPRLRAARLLVTYNGRGFDVPVLRNRAVLCRMELALEGAGAESTGCEHLDLLPLCRRLFRARLPDCRLQSVERELLGLERVGDLDGSEAPRAYSRYLAGNGVDDLLRVLEHNRLDVAVLAGVLWSISRRAADPLHWAEDAEELLALGQLHLRGGRPEIGEACLGRGLELARSPLTRRRLLSALARQLRRRGFREEAGHLWERHCREFPDHGAGWIELAKYHEHVTKDLQRALALVEKAPGGDPDERGRRVARLRRRLGLVVQPSRGARGLQ